jgi:hypothetical protein
VRLLALSCRLALLAIVTAVLLGATIAGVLAYPQPFFAHQIAEGRLELYSDRPFDTNAGRAILADVEARLDRSTLNDGQPHRIFIANAEWRRRLFFLWGYGAGGINFYPVAGGVFLRQADVEAGRLLKSDGTPVPPPRTLAYYAAHEIGHDFIAERIGAITNRRLPVWIREGLADYIAFGGDVDIDALLAAMRRGDPDLDPERSGTYARYRLLVAFMLEREGWSVDHLQASGMTQVEAESRLPRS